MQDDSTECPKLCECGCGQQTRLASITNTKRGWTKGKPLRFVHGHTGGTTTRLRVRVTDRGYLTPCWIWRGVLDIDGYGVVRRAGRKYRAHRLSYEIAGRVIPEGYVLDHLCRTRGCVNPDHLEAITNVENRRRSSRLTEEDVQSIRTADKTLRELAEEFGLSSSYISQIRRRQRLT